MSDATATAAAADSPPLESPQVEVTPGGELIAVGDKKLYMFSDIEGCQNDTKDQSHALCKPEFYTKIAKMLDDKNVHVAFLGDYFDQGMHVHSSITGLKRLLDNKDFGSRVYVILGNRDVNKLRFIYELNDRIKIKKSIPKMTSLTEAEITNKIKNADGSVSYSCPTFDKGWSNAWNSYYWGLYNNQICPPNNCQDANPPIADNSVVDLVKHILKSSMGAGKEENRKMTGLYSFMPFDKIEKADDATALDYLMSAFGIQAGKKPEDALDVLAFFNKCKLAHVFEGKVLLAHGGGFDPDAFFDQNYVDGYTGYGKTVDYLQRLEEFRRRLSGMKMDPNDPDDLPSSHDGSISVQGSVDVYNKLFKEVLSEIDEVIRDKTFYKLGQSRKFILLQALGLKPDKEDARYKSLIQSCSQNGCVGPTLPLSNDPKGTKLEEVLSKSGITHVCSGHKPVCFPLPLIYRRARPPSVTFISNDTSNGNRKILEIGDNAVIGTSITIKDDGNHVSQVETISLDGKDDSPAKTKYESMFGPFSKENLPPVYETASINLLKYATKKDSTIFDRALFKLKGPYDQLVYVGAGGRRRSRNRKRNTKRVSRYISKRTRRNKQTRRGRKPRKSSV
jgi:hypothetical protein